MSDIYILSREVNQYLGWVSFLWLIYRTVRAWPAEWAKPDHVGHYRILLCITSGLILGATYGAYWYETHPPVPANLSSSLFTVFIALTLGMCIFWPQPFKKDEP